jgi:YafQ family addiction module toxin component
MYALRVRGELDKKFFKLSKKDPKQLKIINKKIQEIRKDPHRYKNLRAPLNNWKRVHIDRHFVLTYTIDEKNKTVILEDYDHHDLIYKH